MKENDHSKLTDVVSGNTAFALNLYNQLRHTEGNLFCSPYSISTALAMTYAGARGRTAQQMAETLHFPLDHARLHPAFADLEKRLSAVQSQGNILLKVANSLWLQSGYVFLDEFIDLLKECYGTPITPLDFQQIEASRTKINTWVEERTQDKIKELIKPGHIDALTILVLVNAIYFKGDWAHPFDDNLTKDAPFWISADEKIETPMMSQKGKFGFAQRENLQILELPYAGQDLSMVVLLPKEVDGLAVLEDSLTLENLADWTGNLRESEVQVFLPRFKMSSSFELSSTLGSMGMSDAFDANADFSGMDGSRSLFISAVIHKAFVDVNEEGTEAAAATAVVMARGMPPHPATFRADHPFIFLIRDNASGSILFLGRVVDPSVEGE